MSEELKKHDLEGVLWREYDFFDEEHHSYRTYHINRPVAFWHRSGGETHRVLDAFGIVHIVPAPGFHGCVLRYLKEDGYPPVVF